MQQAALTNRLQAAPDLIYQLIGAVRRVPKGLASASAFFLLFWDLACVVLRVSYPKQYKPQFY